SNLLIPIGTVRADRLLFVPSLGVALAAGCLLERGLRRGGAARAVAAAVLVGLPGFYSWRSVTRNLDWRTQEALWTATVRDNPGSAVGWSFVGDFRRDRDELESAAEAYRRAFELRDGAGFFYPEAHNRYADAVNRLGRRDEAIEHYRRVLEELPQQPTALLNLGEALLHAPGTRDESVEVLQRLSRLTPDDFRVHVNLAQALRLAGRLDEASASIDRAARLRPGEPFIWDIKAMIESLRGRDEEARRAQAEASRLRGGSP
ncbi:MAG: tetratricopeptide repeat protein, partial [Planctomycetota bacterium]